MKRSKFVFGRAAKKNLRYAPKYLISDSKHVHWKASWWHSLQAFQSNRIVTERLKFPVALQGFQFTSLNCLRNGRAVNYKIKKHEVLMTKLSTGMKRGNFAYMRFSPVKCSLDRACLRPWPAQRRTRTPPTTTRHNPTSMQLLGRREMKASVV